MIPWPPNPTHWMNHGTPAGAATIAWWSGVSGYRPAQHFRALMGTSSRNAKRLPMRVAIASRNPGSKAVSRVRSIVRIRVTDEEAGTFAADEHSRVCVDAHRNGVGHARNTLGDGEIALARCDRDVDAGHRRQTPGERACSVDDVVGFDVAGVGAYERAAVRHVDAEHLGVEQERGPEAAGFAPHRAHDAVRIDDPVSGTKRGGAQSVDSDEGHALGNVLGRQPVHVNAHRSLEFEAFSQRCSARLGARHEEISDAAKPNLTARAVVQLLQLLDRELREHDVARRRELRTNAAVGTTCRTHPR